MIRSMLAGMTFFLLAACGSTGPDAALRTTASRTLSGLPNSVAVQPDGTVFVTDDTTNSILRSSASDVFSAFATLPADNNPHAALSQIVPGLDGDLFAERFGFGTASAIFHIDANGHVALFSDTNPERRRLGLAMLDRNRVLSSWFVKKGADPAQGGVSLITVDSSTGHATERDLVTGLAKPVGIAIAGDSLYISDQAANRIVKANLRTILTSALPLPASDASAQVDAPDLLAVSADGSLFTKCGDHAICRISVAGQSTILADHFDEPRGIAIDAARNLLYAVDRAHAGQTSQLRVVPIPPCAHC